MICRGIRKHQGLVPLTLAAFSAVSILAACEGPAGQDGLTGPAGPQGATGPKGTSCTVTEAEGVKTIKCDDGTTATVKDGDKGEAGTPGETITEGTLSGTLKGEFPDKSTTAAEGVKVEVNMAGVAAATTDNTGAFTLSLPAGVYEVKLSGTGFETKTLNAYVRAKTATDLSNVVLVRTNPLKVTGATLQQVGFRKQVTLGVTGMPASAIIDWKQTAGPTTVTLSSTTAAAPTFTTGSFQDIIANPKLNTPFVLADRTMWLGITTQQTKDMTYKFEATVTDGKWSTKAVVNVIPAAVTLGLANAPKGVMAVANTATAATYNWTLTKPTGSNATLEDATTRNPFFIPDVAGEYTLTNGTATLKMKAGDWAGMTASCAGCHTGTDAEDMYNAWKDTGHATLFHEEIDGLEGDHYSQNCITCHTTGYNAAANNNGFDDVAKAKGWTFPNPPKPGEYDKMPPELQAFASISCENCHGPVTMPHSAGQMQGSMDSRVCASCHDSLSHHDRYPLWLKSAHANLQGATANATVEVRPNGSSAHCGRCHAAQGYRAWIQQLQNQNLTVAQRVGNILQPNGTAADDTYLGNLGLKNATVEAVSCQTCHEPHSDALRFSLAADESIDLPSGFKITGGGAGALCMTCHNSRNGARHDNMTMTAWSAPHQAGQTDVFMGENAFFVARGQLSDHAALEESCVTCHVEMVPAGVTAWNTNHTFKADRTTCAHCHGEGVTGEAQAIKVETAMEKLHHTFDTKMVAYLQNVVTKFGSYKVTDANTSTVYTLTAVPSQAELVEGHGQIEFHLFFAAPVTATKADNTTVQISDVPVQLRYIKYVDATVEKVAVPAAHDLTKAAWNYFLLHGDGSHGAHNPSFTTNVIDATQAKLDAWTAAAP